MPQSHYLLFEAPQHLKVIPRKLHAALCRIFDAPMPGVKSMRLPSIVIDPRENHRPNGFKPWCVSRVEVQNGKLGLEIRLLADELEGVLNFWKNRVGHIYLGTEFPEDLPLINHACYRRASFTELAEHTAACAWNLEFITPVVFLKRPVPEYDLRLSSIVESLHSKWVQISPETAPELPGPSDYEDIQSYFDTAVVSCSIDPETAPERMEKREKLDELVAMGLTPKSVVRDESWFEFNATAGSIQVEAEGEAARKLSAIFALAAYTNVGSHANFGFGALNVSEVQNEEV